MTITTNGTDTQLQNQAINCAPHTWGMFDSFPTLYGPSSVPTVDPAALRVESVTGGYIVSGRFPGKGFLRCVAANKRALAQLLSQWCSQYEATAAKKE